MIDITTWIAQTKPKFDDLLNQEFRSFIVFNILLNMDFHTTQSDVTAQTYIWDILGELNDVFMWNESNFLYDYLPDTTLGKVRLSLESKDNNENGKENSSIIIVQERF